MKYLVTLLTILVFETASFAQPLDKISNTVDVQGYSKLLIDPPNYVAHILIQEEEQKVGYTTIGKLQIDSVKLNFFTNLKKFGIEEKDIKILGISSKEIGQYPSFLSNISYEIKLKDKTAATKLVNELRFTGLKGVVIKRNFTKEQKQVLIDSLYNLAVEDAKRNATELAKKANKQIGEITLIEVKINTLNSPYTDYDSGTDTYNTYSYTRFEMDFRDKFANCNVRVVFVMK